MVMKHHPICTWIADWTRLISIAMLVYQRVSKVGSVTSFLGSLTLYLCCKALQGGSSTKGGRDAGGYGILISGPMAKRDHLQSAKSRCGMFVA